ncbi:DUF447 domain-containing protein [Halocatena halophila]|uniref:DUF447 domain-containing protein n=1 Tax=Halocatena halophila TaxID=2814576 RepID=UPI002ED3162B
MTADGWPVALSGVTETIVTTQRPDGRWNVAALGLFDGESVTAKTWGHTRTRRGFHATGEGIVQFTQDPVDFVEAACSRRTDHNPILDSADAWVRVSATSIETTDEFERWHLEPLEARIETERVPTTNRGYYAIIEATVGASRLGVPEYDNDAIVARIEHAKDVVERCGGPRERAAWKRFTSLVDGLALD